MQLFSDFSFQVIEETGVSAMAVHGRTKDERPNHDNHIEYIQAITQVCLLYDKYLHTDISVIEGVLRLLNFLCIFLDHYF